MHYANGRAAKIGDLVRGKGYNLKHEFTGVLIFANPGASRCNAQVATVTAPPNWSQLRNMGSYFSGLIKPDEEGKRWELVSEIPDSVKHCVEHGQLDAFVALDPNTGEVLPPEDQPQPEQSA